MSSNWIIKEYDSPWRYVTIDNFFDDSVWNYINEGLITNPKDYYSKFKNKFSNQNGKLVYGSWNRAVNNDGRYLSYMPHEDSILLDYFRTHLSEEFLKSLFHTHRGHQNLSDHVHIKHNFNLFAKAGIHEDVPAKVFSTVVYVHPLHECGTLIYSSDDGNSLEHIVNWKPNRAFIFAPLDKVTWHDFMKIDPDNERITIDYNLIRDESDLCLPNESKDV